MPFDGKTQAWLEAGERAAFARLEADFARHDGFMEELEKCETLDDAFNVFGNAIKRLRNDNPIFDFYQIDGYDIAVCEDCGYLVDIDEATDQCPHCGFTYEQEGLASLNGLPRAD